MMRCYESELGFLRGALNNELIVREGRLKVVEGRLKVGSRPGETEASAATDLG